MRDQTPAEPEPLILPRGVRFPHPDEFPAGSEAEQARIRQAQISTGYRLIPNTGGAYAAFIQANAHAINLWALFHDLALTIMPRVTAPIIALKGGDSFTGPYTMRAAALRVFEPHVQALQHDGLLAFGLISQQNGMTDQIFVQPSKDIQIWTNQPAGARPVFARHGIPEVKELQVMGQFSLVSESIESPEGGPASPGVIRQVRAGFAALPSPDR